MSQKHVKLARSRADEGTNLACDWPAGPKGDGARPNFETALLGTSFPVALLLTMSL